MRKAIRNRMALDLAERLELEARLSVRLLPGNRFTIARANLKYSRAERLRRFAHA